MICITASALIWAVLWLLISHVVTDILETIPDRGTRPKPPPDPEAERLRMASLVWRPKNR